MAAVAPRGGAPQTAATDEPRHTRDLVVLAGAASDGAPAGRGANDFAVKLGVEAVKVVDARPLARGEWAVLVYVDLLAGGEVELERAAAALELAAPDLVGLGPVTVLVADELVEPWIEGTTDAGDLAAAFAELGVATFEAPEERTADFVVGRRAVLLDELGARPWGTGARALFLVGDLNAERSGVASSAGEPAARGELAAAVAALGWVALPLHLGGVGGVAVSPLAEETGGEAIQDASSLPLALARLADRLLLRIEVPAGGATSSGSAGAMAPLSLAGPGGSSVRAARWLATSTPSFVVLARVNALVSRDQQGALVVEAAAALDSDTSGEDVLAIEVLARHASDGGAAIGRFEGRSSRLRASFVLARLEEVPVIVHHPGSGVPFDGASGWLLQARLDAPDDLEGIAVVVEDTMTGSWGAAIAEVEGDGIATDADRLATEVADLRAPRRSAAATAAAAAAGSIDSSLVRLVPPRGRELRGTQTFHAMALNAFIARVVFFLDGRQAAEDRDAPFVARLDLGADAKAREIRAVAYDRAGRQLGEDTVTVNRPRTSFGIEIVEVRGAAPVGDGAVRGAPRAPPGGPIEVVAAVAVPPRRRIERVEIYWNESLEATLTSAPWSASLRARPSTAGDYVRAVAVLDDGQSLEDVELVGVPGQVEEVEVNLVEIFAVALDREGMPVHDLTRDEVAVRLGGQDVKLERFGVAEDLPLDVGLVIDTSLSMEFLMDDTRQAAMRFLADAVRPGDRAFLVDFDSKPRLAHPMTRKVTDLVRALGTLRPSGNTALYDSILFSILHFEEGEDRRAVVLLTDGDDVQSRFSARQAALQARSAGVPIYMISLAGMDSLRPAVRKTDLETIAKQTGGHVFYVSERDQIAAAYARIGAELRSQYVLAFATPRALQEAELAKLEVRVTRPGTTVRAVVAGRSVQTR